MFDTSINCTEFTLELASTRLRTSWHIDPGFVRDSFGFLRGAPSETRTIPERIPNEVRSRLQQLPKKLK